MASVSVAAPPGDISGFRGSPWRKREREEAEAAVWIAVKEEKRKMEEAEASGRTPVKDEKRMKVEVVACDDP